MKKSLFILLFAALAFSGCVFSSKKDAANSEAAKQTGNQNGSTDKTAPGDSQNQSVKKESDSQTTARTDCLNIKISGRKIDAKQTFPVDFAPFKKSCFVTAHDPEFTDPPLDSKFFIYRDGKEIYKFPNEFNGVTTGCWAEAVAFQDLNDDDLTDIIIAGMCSAKSAPYSENMVYVNNGSGFTTNEEANYTLEKFKKIKDIADFVKNNREQFFQ